jgi:hypothetical protein
LWCDALSSTDARVPVHATRCRRDARFSEPTVSLADFCNLIMAPGHTRRATDPRAREGLSSRCSPAPTDAGCVSLPMRCRTGRPASRDAHAAAHASRVPLAWTGLVTGRSARVKARRTSRATCANPPRDAPGTSRRRRLRGEAWNSSPLHRRPRSTSDHTSRKALPQGRPKCLRPPWNSYASGRRISRARPNRNSFTPPPKGHCSGDSRAFVNHLAPPRL